MLEKTLYSGGKDQFQNYTFSAREWSAPTMVSPGEIRKRVASFKLEGRTIKRFRMIGMSYMLRREWIEEHIYCGLDQYDEEERQARSDYENIDPETLFGVSTQIDEPFLIEFEDGDRFEIDTPQESEFRMSMNCIPWGIEPGTNPQNVDANVLFAACIGRTIINVEVRTYVTDKEPMFSGQYFDKQHSKRELVSAITLWLDDGNGISIGGCIDFCEVSYIDKNRALNSIPFKDLMPSLYNWEDLHIDEITRFEASAQSFFFGDKGRKRANTPFITLSPSGCDTALYISSQDFLLFDWCITYFCRERFDEYGEYEFTKEQWDSILDIGECILEFECFDDLFDYLTGTQITERSFAQGNNMFIGMLNYGGVEFWTNRDRYRTQLKDMREWSRLVLLPDGAMSVYGF